MDILKLIDYIQSIQLMLLLSGRIVLFIMVIELIIICIKKQKKIPDFSKFYTLFDSFATRLEYHYFLLKNFLLLFIIIISVKMDYSRDVYTPRSRKDKTDLIGNLNLKTRNLEESNVDLNGVRPRRAQSTFNEPDSQRSQKPKDANCVHELGEEYLRNKQKKYSRKDDSKYTYETKYEPEEINQEQRRDRQPRDSNNQYQTRDMRQFRQIPAKELPYNRRERQRANIEQEKPSNDYNYTGHRRNQKLLRQSRGLRNNKQNAERKENVGITTGSRVMDKQVVEKLYTISKLNSRIAQKLKNMSVTFDKHR